ncbi:MAG: hypothetical protein QME81_12915, partial [bacterium]|nr:hypothetical protein [bacterium]
QPTTYNLFKIAIYARAVYRTHRKRDGLRRVVPFLFPVLFIVSATCKVGWALPSGFYLPLMLSVGKAQWH